MKKYKILRSFFMILALILSHAMCIEIAFNYASMLCAIKHMGFSAPADTTFLLAVPYGIGIIICVILTIIFNNKTN